MLTLAKTMREPFGLLYVLHTPRGEANPGRYQSEDMSVDELISLFNRYHRFFQSDGRYDLWIRSQVDSSMLIWDRHDLLYAYGELKKFADVLDALEFHAGDPNVPSPHQHHYRQEMDDLARSLIEDRRWRHLPLQPEAEQ